MPVEPIWPPDKRPWLALAAIVVVVLGLTGGGNLQGAADRDARREAARQEHAGVVAGGLTGDLHHLLGALVLDGAGDALDLLGRDVEGLGHPRLLDGA